MNEFLDDFTRDIARGLSSRYLREQSPPQARWQSPETVMTSKLLAYDPDRPGAKILVGAMDDRLIGIEDNRHVLTVAGNRSGKSVMLIGNLLFYRGSVLAMDPKGELANITAARRKSLGQHVVVLDPFGITRVKDVVKRAAFNPMARLTVDSPTLIEDATILADALVIAEGRDPHWDESARDLIQGVILQVATAPQYEGRRNLVTARGLLLSAMVPEDAADVPEGAEPLKALERAMLENAERLEFTAATQDIAAAVEGAARDFFERSPTERASVLSTARRHTRFLDYAAMRRVLTGHDFDLADLKRRPGGLTVYLCLPAGRMGLCRRWLRIFVNQLLDAMERERTAPPLPVLTCLDEFPVLGYMEQLENAAGQIASFGVKLWVVLQDWSQGKALYRERWETFAGNAGILQFFGNNDLATTEYVSRRLGKTRVAVTRESDLGPEQRAKGGTGRSQAVELHDLLSPEEVSRLFARSDRLKRQLVMWAGYHPMIVQRVEYFDEGSRVYRHFRGKYERP